MKHGIIIISLLLGFGFQMKAQTTKTVGTGGDYTTLAAAFTAINDGTITGNIVLQILSNTTETTANLNKSGTGSASYSSVMIYPTVENLTITGQISLSQAENVTINGSINASGSNKNLTIKYDGNGNTVTMNSASNNAIRNLVLKNTGNLGVIKMIYSEGASAGCTNNLIDNCTFTGLGTRSSCGIYSQGSSASILNANNTVSNCEFINFIDVAFNSTPILLQAFNNSWTIDNNSFYETGGVGSFTASKDIRAITVQADVAERTFVIKNNKIGGSDANCGGDALLAKGSVYHKFYGLYLSNGSYTLTNNVIKNINLVYAERFYGIYMIQTAAVNVSDNQIGSTTETESIRMSYNIGGYAYGIGGLMSATSFARIYTNNSIGGISQTYTGSGAHTFNVYGINDTYFTKVSNNTIGSSNTANSITTPISSGGHSIIGISSTSTTINVADTISGNTIANLTNLANGNNGTLLGISIIQGSSVVQNNTIHHLKINSSPPAGNFAGLKVYSSTLSGYTIVGNQVYNLSNERLSGTGYVNGILVRSSTSTKSLLLKNTVNNLFQLSPTGIIYGINENGGLWDYVNNMISLGSGVNTPVSILGLTTSGGSLLIYNSIVISGNVESNGGGLPCQSYAIYSTATASRTYKNNIFINNRTDNITHYKQYTIQLAGTTNLTINNNNYRTPAGVLGIINGVDFISLTDWRTATGQDANSFSEEVSFISTNDLHLSGSSASNANLIGTPVANYTTDFDDVIRSSSSPTMGIHEVGSWLGSVSSNWGTSANWRFGNIPTNLTDVSVSSTAPNQPQIDNSTTAQCKDISLNSGASLTIEPGGKLTVSGNFSNNGSVNINSSATGTGSLITNGTVTGSDFNIQQYLTPNKWHLISVPNNVSTANTFLGDYLQSWSESTAAWTDIIDPETPLSLMTGYTVYKSGSAATKTFEGTPATGNQSTTLSYHNLAATGNDGMNLVGNPYPSAINWDGLQDTYGAAYIWDPSASSGAGDYLEWNASSGGNQNIAPMQGFFIYTATNGSFFQLTNNNRVHASGSYYKSVQGKLQNSLVLTGSNGIYEDEFILQFNDQANAGFELTRDAWKITSGGSGISQIYSISPDGKLAMDVRPFEKVISLGFSNDKPGTYTIALKQLTDLGNAVLEDTWNNTFTDLAKGAYTFNWQPSDDEQRFRLHMGALDIKVNETDPAVTVYSHNNTLYCSLADTREADIKVYSMAGQLLINRTNVSGIQQFQLASGAYVVIIVNETNTMVKKVIVR